VIDPKARPVAAHDGWVLAAKIEQTTERYPAMSLIGVGRGRSVHLAVRAGRFGMIGGGGGDPWLYNDDGGWRELLSSQPR